ncbi:hypothetical protein llap_19209 [Limosa lapponica baueri]|uniref:Ectonucleoside triphosphate diphosphohydrolase 8 n=1 Tax=Limosa lapponica baueri TaxID=1758121 RepID=A0A2I0T9N0_LIMLA|nr:hypothetical protein llap_19209 [Limosa lapponica baueri]
MDYKAKTIAGLLAATCVFSIIALILSVVNVKDVFLPPSTKYGLVFDAGSTHTALYIYRWPADKENGTGIVSQVEACTVSGECVETCLSLSVPVQRGDTGLPRADAGQGGCPTGQAGWFMPGVDSATPQQISHPCYPKGYQENVITADLYNSPCVHAPSTASPAQVLTVTGTGDPALCRTAIRDLFNSSCGANRTCGFNGAFAGFYYTFHFLNLTSQQSLNDVNSTVETFCKKNWAELVKTFPQQKRYLHTYCPVAIYILTLLLDGYKFDEHTWSSIHFSRQVRTLRGCGSEQAAAAVSLPWPEDMFRNSIPGVPCAPCPRLMAATQ